MENISLTITPELHLEQASKFVNIDDADAVSNLMSDEIIDFSGTSNTLKIINQRMDYGNSVLKQALKNAGIDDASAVSKLTIAGPVNKYVISNIRRIFGNTLQELDLTNTLIEKIDFWSLYECIGLTSIKLPCTVREISTHGMKGYNGNSITSIEVHPENTVFSSQDGVLFNKEKTQLIYCPRGKQGEYVIPNTVKGFRHHAFCCCTGLTSIIIPNSVETIEPATFIGCSGLTSIIIPDSVVAMGGVVFKGCTGLKSVIFSKSLDIIRGFNDCIGLTSINISGEEGFIIPDTVKEIYRHAFAGCTGLLSVVLPDSVKAIGENAFEDCTALTSIFIPTLECEIDEGAFEGCTALSNIVLHPDNPFFTSENGNLYNKEKTVLLKYFQSQPGEMNIPETVTVIDRCAVCGCVAVTSAIIPNSVNKIKHGAFYDCSGLTTVIVPDSVTEIGSSAFCGCSALTSIVLPASLEKIAGWLFAGCSSLTSIVIPETVWYIDEDAFRDCIALTSVHIPASVVRIDDCVFANCPAVITVHPDNPVFKSVNGELVKIENRKSKIENQKSKWIIH